MEDLNGLVLLLNLIYTVEMQQQLRRVLSEGHVSNTSLAQRLDQAHQQDMQQLQLQGQLEQLFGGQAEMNRQMAAATQEQRQQWAAVAGHLGQLAGDVGVIKEDLGVIKDDLRALYRARVDWFVQ
jgi:hypothetical protein